MKEFNLAVFQWISAGYEPNPWLLLAASAIALGGWWAGVVPVGWAAWRQPSERGYVMAALVACVATAILAHAVATALNLPRPFMPGLSPTYVVHGARGSLPSSHASVMFTVALIFLLRPRLRNLGFVMAAVATITGWAKIYVGVHFPMDIAAGMLLAVLVAGGFVLVARLCRRYGAPFIERDDIAGKTMAPEMGIPPEELGGGHELSAAGTSPPLDARKRRSLDALRKALWHGLDWRQP